MFSHVAVSYEKLPSTIPHLSHTMLVLFNQYDMFLVRTTKQRHLKAGTFAHLLVK